MVKLFTHAVSCPHCGSEIIQNWSDYIVSSDVVDEEREMGAEIEHSIECDEFDCPECGKKFSVSGSVWEYPVGAYNDHELHAFVIDN